ncbi:LppU/SCO3897 family protein [Kitasatospora griseola]
MSNPVPPPPADAFAAPAYAAPGAETTASYAAPGAEGAAAYAAPGAEAAAAPQPQFHGPFCRFCGSVPAVEATVRGHQGFIVLMRFLKLRGPFCRDCGLASVRRMTSNSLWQGWWGIGSMLINPITMLSNLGAWSKVRRLPAPLPGAPATPMPVGRPLWKRVEILGLLLPVLLISALVWNGGHSWSDTGSGPTPTRVYLSPYPTPTSSAVDPANVKVGDCLHQVGGSTRTFIVVVDCGASNADSKVVGRSTATTDDVCDAYPDSDSRLVRESGSHPVTLCLVKLTHATTGTT